MTKVGEADNVEESRGQEMVWCSSMSGTRREQKSVSGLKEKGQLQWVQDGHR